MGNPLKTFENIYIFFDITMDREDYKLMHEFSNKDNHKHTMNKV